MTWFQKVMAASAELEMAARTFDLGRYRRVVATLQDLGSDLEMEDPDGHDEVRGLPGVIDSLAVGFESPALHWE